MSFTGDPAKYGAPITPSNDTNLEAPTRAVYVGISGNVVAIMNGEAITFNNVPVGLLPIQCTRINLTGTSAQQLVALW
jgi:hypothetical protein